MAQAEVRYETAETASEAGIEAIDAGLHRYGLEAADLAAAQPLSCFARDASGAVPEHLRALATGEARFARVALLAPMIALGLRPLPHWLIRGLANLPVED